MCLCCPLISLDSTFREISGEIETIPLFFLFQPAESTATTKGPENAEKRPHLSFLPNTIQSWIIWQSHGLASPSRLSHCPVPPFGSQGIQGSLSSATMPSSSALRRDKMVCRGGAAQYHSTQPMATTLTALPARARYRVKWLKWWSSGHETAEAPIANSSMSPHR